MNIDIVRRGYEAVRRGGISALLEGWDPEIVVDDPARPDPTSPDGLHRGVDAVVRHLLDWQESFTETVQEPVELFETSDDTVIVRVRTTARGGSSGIVIENERYHVITLRDGKVAALAVREDRSDALAAAERRQPT
jgi:ketosteroid isomerase-like protein